MKTIYALSSGPGISGISVIRTSGPDTKTIIKELTKSEIPKPRLATLIKINKINLNYYKKMLNNYNKNNNLSVIKYLNHSIIKIK